MGSVLIQLDRDWARLLRDGAAARRLDDVLALAGVSSLAALEQHVRTASPADADRVLVSLVARAVEGDAAAARVLLQLLLPGVRRLARTWWALGDADERAAAAVAAVYDRIRRYPIARRPSRIAANILMDAATDLRRAARATPPVADSGHFPSGWDLAAPTPEHPALELVDALADAVRSGLIAPGDAELIAASRIGGTSLREIAEARGAKLRTLQWRRKRAEAVLAGAGAAAPDGAGD
jgi:DNA-directed RNA polymerase specialized sigma24 family protein